MRWLTLVHHCQISHKPSCVGEIIITSERNKRKKWKKWNKKNNEKKKKKSKKNLEMTVNYLREENAMIPRIK